MLHWKARNWPGDEAKLCTCIALPDAVHVIWSGSPTRHTGANVIGDNVTIPALKCETTFIILQLQWITDQLTLQLANMLTYCCQFTPTDNHNAKCHPQQSATNFWCQEMRHRIISLLYHCLLSDPQSLFSYYVRYLDSEITYWWTLTLTLNAWRCARGWCPAQLS